MQNKANTFFLFLSNTLYVCFLLDFGVATLSFVSASKIPFAAGITIKLILSNPETEDIEALCESWNTMILLEIPNFLLILVISVPFRYNIYNTYGTTQQFTVLYGTWYPNNFFWIKDKSKCIYFLREK